MRSLFVLLAFTWAVESHLVVTHPLWRGNSLITNDSWPYGMQWHYPCGGMPLTTNRTFWPTHGGVLSFQPGWFRGHLAGFLQANLGYGTDGPDGGPLHMTVPLVDRFAFTGPTNNPYPGTLCLNVSLPNDAPVKAGDNATIQVVLLAQHGAAIMSCSDITLVKPDDPRLPQVNDTVCFNSTDIGFADTYFHTVRNPMPIGQQNLLS